VYPIYNEIENLPRLVPETRRIATGIFSHYEVILVDDGSTDGSGSFIDQLAAEYPFVTAIHHQRNRGLGAAIRTGLVNASQELVLYMDSDFPVSVPEARAALLQVTPEVDLLIGYRVGRAEGPRREVMSWTYNRLIRRGFGLAVRDVNFAFKLIRRSLVLQMGLRSEGSFIDAEILLEARRLGARVREIGFRYYPRVAGVSTAASTGVVVRLLGEAWRYRRMDREAAPASLILNADDFGLCEAVNAGVVEAFDRGVLTSASILPTGRAFHHALLLAQARPRLDLGIHIALTQGRPLCQPEAIPSLVGPQGYLLPTWRSFVKRYLAGGVRKQEIEAEMRAQIEHARQAGLRLSHLDSHQHLHMLPGILPVAAKLASEYGIGAIRYPRQRRWQSMRTRNWPARMGRAAEGTALRAVCRLGAGIVKANGLLAADDFRGFREAGGWDAGALARSVSSLGPGLTEICCHPGADDGIEERFPWGYQWEQELAALKSQEVASVVRASGVDLTTFRDYLAQER